MLKSLLKKKYCRSLYWKNTSFKLIGMAGTLLLSQSASAEFKPYEESGSAKNYGFFVSVVNQADLRGRVIDEKGKPVAFATVLIVNTKKAIQTDENGVFVLKDVPEGAFVAVTYVGYKRKEVKAVNNMTIQISPATDLDEVVVVGYSSQKKTNITGSVSSIKMDKITDIPVSNMSNALAGRAPGVTVTNSSGLSGASSAIRVRGSFREPLYVINGVLRTKAAFDALDPNEIDQINVLKDAASAAVYGSQAGNGVVVVTTKTGKEQKPQFSFQVSSTLSTTTETPLADITTATDELTYQNRVAQFEAEQAGRLNTFVPPNGAREFDYFKDRNYNANDRIWRNPLAQKYLFSVNGGSDKVTYFTVAGYTKEQGSYKNLDFGKFNLRSDVTVKLSEALSMNLNLAASQQNGDRFYWPFDSADSYSVGDFYRVTFNWTKLYPFYLNADGSPSNGITPFPVQTPMGSFQAWNVIDQVEGDRYIQTKNRQFNPVITLNAKLDALTKGLSAKLLASYEATDFMRKLYMTYQKNYVFIPADAAGNRFIPAAPDPNRTNIYTFSQAQPNLQYQMQNGWRYQVDGFLNYDRAFGKHRVSGQAIFEQSESKNYYTQSIGYAPVSSIDQMFAYSTSAGNRYGDAAESIYATQSIIGKAGYNYNDRYIADFSFRYDGIPLFGEGKRWGFFPSVALAWRASEESFLKDNVSWLSDLKLRLSYGSTGNLVDVSNNPINGLFYDQPVNRFLYEQVYANANQYIFGNTLFRGIGPGATPNPNITWATIYNYNAGIDYGFLKNKLSGSIDVFLNKMTNILGPRTITLPASYGQGLAPENYAARSFRGLDFTTQWQDKIGNVSYSVYGNLGYAIDRWDVLDQSADYLPGGVNAWRSAIGQPANRVFGFKAQGIIRTQQQLDELKARNFRQYGRTPYLGAILYEDVRGDAFKPGADGKIDDNDIQLLSNNGSPRINFGFGLRVNWKSLSIDALMQGVGAYDRMISNLDGAGIRQWGGNFRTYYPIWASDVWTPENPDAKYPRVVGQNWAESGTNGSTFWIRNGAYLRMRNINIAYDLPLKWINKIGLLGTQIFVNGTNVFTFSPMREFHDPEQENYDSYPIMQTFTLGLNVKF